MGGDSAGLSGWETVVRADPKVFINGPFVMGFTTSFRMGQLLRYAFEPPEHSSDVEDHRFMATTFVDAVRECLKAGGYAKKENEVELAGDFLVGYRGHLYEVDTDYQVGESVDGYMAIGTGSATSVGALYATKGRAPRVRVRLALEAAARHNGAVCAPFIVMQEPAEVIALHVVPAQQTSENVS